MKHAKEFEPTELVTLAKVINRTVETHTRPAEIWVRDPDGYLVVLAGPSEYRPRR